MKRCIACLLLLSLLPVLSGCTVPDTLSSEAMETLPPAAVPYEAPTGTEDLRFTAYLPLYLPTLNERNLTSVVSAIRCEHGTSSAQSVVSALLSTPTDSTHLQLGGNTQLFLSGRFPIETAGNVCTVQLDASALSATTEYLYIAGLAIASSLYGIEDIRYVNLLVNERAIGMDLTDNLPMGSLTQHSGVELPVLLQQMESRRTPLGGDPATVPLTCTGTLYFPIVGEEGFVPEVRNLTFQGQTPSLLALGLLQALSSGSQYTQGAAHMPDLLSYLTQDPDVSELPSGGRLLTLRFVSDLTSRLSLLGFDPSAVIGSMVYTLTTFIPGLSAVRIFSGSTLMTSLTGDTFGTLYFEEGQQHRRQYTSGLRDLTQICLARGDSLEMVTRTVPFSSAASPFLLLSLLSKGPTSVEIQEGLESVFPFEMDETDLLGIGISDDLLLLNLSTDCEQAIREMDAASQQRLAYALVITLCNALGTQRVRFFFDSGAPETLGTDVFWGGEFLLNHALLEQSRG